MPYRDYVSLLIGHQVNEFNGFQSLRSPYIFRFPHIVADGSFKALSKQLLVIAASIRRRDPFHFFSLN